MNRLYSLAVVIMLFPFFGQTKPKPVTKFTLPPSAAAIKNLLTAMEKAEKDGNAYLAAKAKMEQSKMVMMQRIGEVLEAITDRLEKRTKGMSLAEQDRFWETELTTQVVNEYNVPSGFTNPLRYTALDPYLASFLAKTDHTFFVRHIVRFQKSFVPDHTINLTLQDLQRKEYTHAGVVMGWIFPRHTVLSMRVWDRAHADGTIVCTRDLSEDADPDQDEWDTPEWHVFLRANSDSETTLCSVTIMQKEQHDRRIVHR